MNLEELKEAIEATVQTVGVKVNRLVPNANDEVWIYRDGRHTVIFVRTTEMGETVLGMLNDMPGVIAGWEEGAT